MLDAVSPLKFDHQEWSPQARTLGVSAICMHEPSIHECTPPSSFPQYTGTNAGGTGQVLRL